MPYMVASFPFVRDVLVESRRDREVIFALVNFINQLANDRPAPGLHLIVDQSVQDLLEEVSPIDDTGILHPPEPMGSNHIVSDPHEVGFVRVAHFISFQEIYRSPYWDHYNRDIRLLYDENPEQILGWSTEFEDSAMNI